MAPESYLYRLEFHGSEPPAKRTRILGIAQHLHERGLGEIDHALTNRGDVGRIQVLFRAQDSVEAERFVSLVDDIVTNMGWRAKTVHFVLNDVREKPGWRSFRSQA